jgi:mRNA interferase ChpB
MAVYCPDKGDIIMLNFDPSAGEEIMKTRPALVISRKAFNKHTGFAIVAPITSTVRGVKLEVVLPDELVTQGSILVHQLRSLDFKVRKAKHIESAPDTVNAEVDELVKVITR